MRGGGAREGDGGVRQAIIIRDEALRARVISLIGALSLTKPWQVTIEPWKKRRTQSQLALYWLWLDLVVQHIHEHSGQDKDDVHEALKAKFLPARVVELDGQPYEIRSTKKLSTAEMADYTDKVYAWATSELGLLLPLPEELGRQQ